MESSLLWGLKLKLVNRHHRKPSFAVELLAPACSNAVNYILLLCGRVDKDVETAKPLKRQVRSAIYKHDTQQWSKEEFL